MNQNAPPYSILQDKNLLNNGMFYPNAEWISPNQQVGVWVCGVNCEGGRLRQNRRLLRSIARKAMPGYRPSVRRSATGAFKSVLGSFGPGTTDIIKAKGK